MYSVPWLRALSPEKLLSGHEGQDPNPAENLESNIIVTEPRTHSELPAKVSLTYNFVYTRVTRWSIHLLL